MVPAIALDGRAGPPLPVQYRAPQKKKARQSPLPEEWSEGAEPLRLVIKQIEKLFN